MNRYSKEPEQKQTCEAHGCPLAGSTTSCIKTDEFSSWYCRFHISAKYDDFHAITEKIKEHISLLKYAHLMKVTQNHSVEAFLQNFQNEELNKKEDENYLKYADRLGAWVANQVKLTQL
ncbi:MAG: hypothetical protein COB69_00300 [Phycisphaera sp.]|nr:MAG: hypothetical protein COB69_00300 [Phycisphaera sp.]